MKTKIVKAILGIAVLTATTALNSCSKQKADDYEAAASSALADESYNDAQNIADEASTSGTVSYKTDEGNSLLAGCAVVTRDTVSNPRVTTIDFGSGCTGMDGRVRSGKIIVTYDGKYRDPGTTITITFDNFFVNGNQILGTKTIHNDGANGNGNLSFSIHVEGSVIRANNAGTITWVSDRVREWIAGEPTPSRDDDQYSVTGTGSGVASNGDEFSLTIVEPLIRNLAPQCRRHFVSGQVLLQRSGRPDKLVDFGNGACDDLATVTVNGVAHIIHLHP